MIIGILIILRLLLNIAVLFGVYHETGPWTTAAVATALILSWGRD